MKAGVLTCFCADRPAQLRAVLHQPREIDARAQLSDETGGMPRAARRQRFLLKQQNVALTKLRQMISNRAANGTAADDEDTCAVGQRHARVLTVFRCARGPPSAPRYQSTK